MEFINYPEPTAEEALARYLQQYGYPYSCRTFDGCKSEFKKGFIAGFTFSPLLRVQGIDTLYSEYRQRVLKPSTSLYTDRQGFESGIIYGSIRDHKLTMISRLWG